MVPATAFIAKEWDSEFPAPQIFMFLQSKQFLSLFLTFRILTLLMIIGLLFCTLSLSLGLLCFLLIRFKSCLCGCQTSEAVLCPFYQVAQDFSVLLCWWGSSHHSTKVVSGSPLWSEVTCFPVASYSCADVQCAEVHLRINLWFLLYSMGHRIITLLSFTWMVILLSDVTSTCTFPAALELLLPGSWFLLVQEDRYKIQTLAGFGGACL